MDNKTMPALAAPSSDDLARKFFWYGTAAVGAALTAAPDAGAQVLSTRFDPAIHVTKGGLPLDFDGDGDPELIFHEDNPDGIFYTRNDFSGDALTRIAGRSFCSRWDYFCDYVWSFNAFWDKLGPDVPVGADFPPNGIVQYFVGTHTRYGGLDPYDWSDSDHKFIGLQFRLDGVTHYGWVRMSIRDGEMLISGYAYNATPNGPISTGEVGTTAPAYPLDVDLSQTTFPPQGGPVLLTATVTNPTGEDARLDLWVVIRRATQNISAKRWLGRATVASGETMTQEFELEVPADAPPGTYEVSVYVGEVPRVADGEVFIVTKEGALRAAGEEGEGVLFAGEQDDEAFFAEASSEAPSVEGLPTQTHALSAPRPNPSSGRSQFTLEVAESQAVRVEVYDALGRRVALLHDGALAGGTSHVFTFDGAALPSGVYAVRAVGERFADVRTLTLAR